MCWPTPNGWKERGASETGCSRERPAATKQGGGVSAFSGAPQREAAKRRGQLLPVRVGQHPGRCAGRAALLQCPAAHTARGQGLGTELLALFEGEARARGCTHVFVTSFTFQAPGFYERHGYREIFRWQGVPTPEAADVHLRKEL